MPPDSNCFDRDQGTTTTGTRPTGAGNRKSDDIFAPALAHGRDAIHNGTRLVRAALDFWFTGAKKPRKVQVRPPSILKLGRYCDASVVQRWLSEKDLRGTVRAGA